MRICGECTLCCKLFNISRPDEGLVKPPHTWCPHCLPGKGCGIYDSRPPVCVDFKCAWLSLDWLPDDLRPDRCKAIFQDTGQRVGITCTIDSPEALDNQKVREVGGAVARAQGFMLVMFQGAPYKIFFTHPQAGAAVQLVPFAAYQKIKERGGLLGLPKFNHSLAQLES